MPPAWLWLLLPLVFVGAWLEWMNHRATVRALDKLHADALAKRGRVPTRRLEDEP